MITSPAGADHRRPGHRGNEAADQGSNRRFPRPEDPQRVEDRLDDGDQVGEDGRDALDGEGEQDGRDADLEDAQHGDGPGRLPGEDRAGQEKGDTEADDGGEPVGQQDRLQRRAVLLHAQENETETEDQPGEQRPAHCPAAGRRRACP